jgi:hypothetical protein
MIVGLELDEPGGGGAARFCEALHAGDVETMELRFESASFDAIVCGDFIEHPGPSELPRANSATVAY